MSTGIGAQMGWAGFGSKLGGNLLLLEDFGADAGINFFFPQPVQVLDVDTDEEIDDGQLAVEITGLNFGTDGHVYVADIEQPVSDWQSDRIVLTEADVPGLSGTQTLRVIRTRL